MQFDSSVALDALAALPPDPIRRERSAWGAIFPAIGAAAAEVFSQASRIGIQGMDARRAADDPIQIARDQSRLARERMATDAMQWAVDQRPDPATASKAEEIVFGLTRGLTKAVGLSAIAGPVAGAAAFGLSEGDVAFQDMRRQGVDETTALKVAGVTGVAGTAGVVLPLVGSTVPRTLALYLAGGPGGYIAQQAATREILRSADYGAIAAQYDPLDTAGLAVASLVPLPFVALGLRGARLRAGKPGVAPSGDAASPPEAVDAAMVHNLSTLADQQAVQRANGETAAPARQAESMRAAPAQATDYVPPPAQPAATQDGAQWAAAAKMLSADQSAADTMQQTVMRARAAVETTPDLPVRTDADGKVWSAADEMTEAKRIAAEGTDAVLGTLDADLIRIAAECALSLA